MQSEKTKFITDGESFAGRHVHLIGIGGCGMCALAGMLLSHGTLVSGSDVSSGPILENLTSQGAKIAIGHQAQNVPERCDLVVRSAAIDDQNPELQSAVERGIEVIKYSAMLGRLMAQKDAIAIAGTHGKSTTTAMLAYALKRAGTNPSFIVGASVGQLGGASGVGSGKYFVAEACEFDRSFLDLAPQRAAILNIEEDHLDCYSDISQIIEAFGSFASLVPPDGVLIANGEDQNVLAAIKSAKCNVQTFGQAENCTWRATNVKSDRGRFSMDVFFEGKAFCSLTPPLIGLHNAYNTLAAVALLGGCEKIDPADIPQLLEGFIAPDRRMTVRYESRGIVVVDDYAHHPSEIQATLCALRKHFSPKRIICVFQPHQHSRTRFLLKDFAKSFADADEVIVPDIYFVRDSELEKGYISSEDLVSQIRLHEGSARYIKTFDEIVRFLREHLSDGDMVITMGAGNIWEVSDEIIQWLGTDS